MGKLKWTQYHIQHGKWSLGAACQVQLRQQEDVHGSTPITVQILRIGNYLGMTS